MEKIVAVAKRRPWWRRAGDGFLHMAWTFSWLILGIALLMVDMKLKFIAPLDVIKYAFGWVIIAIGGGLVVQGVVYRRCRKIDATDAEASHEAFLQHLRSMGFAARHVSKTSCCNREEVFELRQGTVYKGEFCLNCLRIHGLPTSMVAVETLVEMLEAQVSDREVPRAREMLKAQVEDISKEIDHLVARRAAIVEVDGPLAAREQHPFRGATMRVAPLGKVMPIVDPAGEAATEAHASHGVLSGYRVDIDPVTGDAKVVWTRDTPEPRGTFSFPHFNEKLHVARSVGYGGGTDQEWKDFLVEAEEMEKSVHEDADLRKAGA